MPVLDAVVPAMRPAPPALTPAARPMLHANALPGHRRLGRAGIGRGWQRAQRPTEHDSDDQDFANWFPDVFHEFGTPSAFQFERPYERAATDRYQARKAIDSHRSS